MPPFQHLLASIIYSVFVLCSNKVFSGSWTQTGEQAFPLLDVGINDKNASYSTELYSSGSWLVKSSNLGSSWTVLEKSDDGFLDIAVSSLSSSKAVASSVLGRSLYTLDGGNKWETSIDPLFGVQSIQRSRDGSGIYCGAGGDKMSISSNSGLSWQHFKISNLTNGTRYCAMPTNKIFYITAGFWIDEDYKNKNKNILSLTSKIKLDLTKNRLRLYYEQNQLKRKQTTRKLLQNDEFMWGEIWKSIDGGISWNLQYFDDNRFYFNGIDCCNEQLCYAVAEGESSAGSNQPGTRIFQTINGGTNWNQVYYNNEDSSSLMTVRCLNSNEVYVGGGNMEGGRNNFFGYFLYSNNAGLNWTNITVKAPVMWMDMTDDGMYGIASGISKESGGVEYGYM